MRNLIADTHAQFSRPLGYWDSTWDDKQANCQVVVRRVVTTAIRYPHTKPEEHFAQVTMSYAHQELAVLRSASAVVDLFVRKSAWAIDKLKNAVHEAGLRILAVDLSRGFPKIVFDEHLSGSGI